MLRHFSGWRGINPATLTLIAPLKENGHARDLTKFPPANPLPHTQFWALPMQQQMKL